MSVDIAWDKFTQGQDGAVLADQIRDFIHDKFQQVALPRFLKSVHVHSFSFGSACPEVEIKDVSDPLPDFYEDDTSDDSSSNSARPSTKSHHDPGLAGGSALVTPGVNIRIETTQPVGASDVHTHAVQDRHQIAPGRTFASEIPTDAWSRSGTPGIPGGTSNFSYFHHLPIGGLSGTQTPLAAVASGTPFSPIMGWQHGPSQPSNSQFHSALAPDPARFATMTEYRDLSTRPSTARASITSADEEPSSLPTSPERLPFAYTGVEKVSDDPLAELRSSTPPGLGMHHQQPSDLQVVARVQYSGDVRLTLTAEILLDYPMPSFVGIPLKLSITGMAFDGVAVLAYIKKRMHFCFLDSDDADTLVGDHVTRPQEHVDARGKHNTVIDGLIKEIHIESEIGRQESGKQVLKNVGKVEKFVLEQIRRIFEDEFVFPSFWTFLL